MHNALYYLLIYFFSQTIATASIKSMLKRIDDKNINHKNIKDAGNILKFLCFVPVLNTGYSLLVIGAWLWGFIFDRKQ